MDFRGKGRRMATPEEQIAALTKQIEEQATALKTAEAGTGGDDELRKRFESLEAQNKELIEGRDKAKQRARDADDAKLAEQGEFKTLSEQLQAEKKSLEEQLAGQSLVLEGIKERDEAKLKTLIELIPENLRETVAGNSGTLAEKIDLAEKLAEVKTPKGPLVRLPGDMSNQTLKEQHAAAVASGDIAAQISLKNKMYEKE
jgi:hypothetical protein